MTISEIYKEFLTGMKHTTFLEYIAVFSGVASVWFSRNESIWTYPVGLINTIVYIYLSFKGHLLGEASVNFYYTVMSLYGWVVWAKRNKQLERVVKITRSDTKWWIYQWLFFIAFYITIFSLLTYLKKDFYPGAIPWADAFASSTAFTGMWLMTRKKVESWWWWIATDFASIPLYFVKHYTFTSVYYFVLPIFAFWGLAEWKRRASQI